MSSSLTEEEIKEIIDYLKETYKTDIKININEGDIEIVRGDIDLTGAVIGKSVGEIKNFVEQIIIINLMSGIEINGRKVFLTDFIVETIGEEELKLLLKAIIIEKLAKIEIIEEINDVIIEKIEDTIRITIKIKTVTLDEIITNIQMVS